MKETQIEAKFPISVSAHLATVGLELTKFSIHSIFLENQNCSPQLTHSSGLGRIAATPHSSVPHELLEPWKLVLSPGWSSHNDSLDYL